MSDIRLEKVGECATCGQVIVCAVAPDGQVLARDCTADMGKHLPSRDYLWDALVDRPLMSREEFDRRLDKIVKQEREVPYRCNVKGRASMFGEKPTSDT